MQFSETELKIVKAVVDRFINDNGPTKRKDLILRFRSPETVDRLIGLKILKVLDNDDNLAPWAYGVAHAEDPEAEKRAKASFEVVLRALQDLYEVTPARKQITRREVQVHVNNTRGETVPRVIDRGLYFIQEFQVLQSYGPAPGPVRSPLFNLEWMVLSERIVTLDVKSAWDDHIRSTAGTPEPINQGNKPQTYAQASDDPDDRKLSRMAVDEARKSVSEQDGRPRPKVGTVERPVAKKETAIMPETDKRKVFVVHGRNLKAREAVFAFLRAIDLAPMEWEEIIALTGQAAPYIGDALERGFSEAQAAVVILTGDDMARVGKRYLLSHDPRDEKFLTPQPRPNVLFEAGMALGKYPDRTLILSLGSYRKFSDIDGRHIVHLSNKQGSRQAVADRLKTAGCDVKTDHKTDWHTAGDFDAAVEDADLPSGKQKMRLRTFSREYKFAPNADVKRKIWIQFRNETDECLTLRNARWKSIPSGIHATIRAGTFQLQLGEKWCPENIGTAQLTLPPGELCRLWAEPDGIVPEEQIKEFCKIDSPLGSVILFANGEEISVPV